MTSPAALTGVIERFGGLRALVIGDLMLDEYLVGEVERVSPEAPIPIVRLRERDARLGGAANVANNLQGLGADVALCGLVGNDEAGQTLRGLCDSLGLRQNLLVESATRRTTRKARVLSRGQQLLRVDTEDTAETTEAERAALTSCLERAFGKRDFDVVLFEDYDKGCLDAELIATVVEAARRSGAKTVVDPKHRNFWAYRDVDLLKPNLAELSAALDDSALVIDAPALDRAHARVQARLGHGRTLVTLGAAGAYLSRGGDAGLLAPTLARSVVDVCGAGDSVAAAVALGLAAGASDAQLLHLANLAGALACAHVGVWPLRRDALLQRAREADAPV